MDAKDELKFLRSIPLLSTLDEHELSDFRHSVQPFEAEQGTVLFHQGDRADGMYLLARGRVRVGARVAGDEVVELALLEAGEWLGELSLIDRGMRSATAVAAEPAMGYFLDQLHFETMRSIHRGWALKVMDRLTAMMCGRIRNINREIAAALEQSPAGPSATERPEPPPWPAAARSSPSNLDRATLSALPVFHGFTRTELEAFLAPLERWDLPRGYQLFAEDDPSDACFISVRGAIRMGVRRGERSEALALVGPGRIFGQVGLLDGRPRSASCTVRENATFLRMAKADFEALRRSESALAVKFVGAVNQSLVATLRSCARTAARLAAEGRMVSLPHELVGSDH